MYNFVFMFSSKHSSEVTNLTYPSLILEPQAQEESFQTDVRFGDDVEYSTDKHLFGGEMPQPQTSTMHPVKLKRRVKFHMVLLVFVMYILLSWFHTMTVSRTSVVTAEEEGSSYCRANSTR